MRSAMRAKPIASAEPSKRPASSNSNTSSTRLALSLSAWNDHTPDRRWNGPSSSAISIRSPEEGRSEEHTSELQSLMRISYAVFCLKKKKTQHTKSENHQHHIYDTDTNT